MKTIRSFVPTVAFLFIAIFTQNFVNAEMNAQAIVNQFNNASGGRRLQFTTSSANFQVTVSQSGSGFADTSAYLHGVTGGSDYFMTFCVEPNTPAYPNMEASLNYANNKSMTTSDKTLTLGAAYLYSQFATGTLDGYIYGSSISSEDLMWALRTLMDIPNIGVPNDDWSTNFFLSQLLETDDKAYWTQVYNPDKYYAIIGNYSVFVMNNIESSAGKDGQDFLYVAKSDRSSNTPEPATIFLWGLGGLGTCAVRSLKKRKM